MKLHCTRVAAAIAVLSFALLTFLLPPPAARSQQPHQNPASGNSLAGALFVVSHVDLLPDSLPTARPALLQYVADSRKDPGALRVELLVQTDRANHFTIVSVWASEKAFNAHLAAAHTRDFRAKLQPGLGSPFDERLHHLAE